MTKHLTKRRVVAYLLYFSLACTLVLGVTYARYSSAITGTGSAHVAAVELELNEPLDLSEQLQGMTPGTERKLSFEISNAKGTSVSQVAQDYSITVNTTGSLPLIFTLAHSDSTTAGTYADTPSNAEGQPVWTWSGGALPHSEEITHTYSLTVTWPAEQADAHYADEIDLVTLTVDAKQAQLKER